MSTRRRRNIRGQTHSMAAPVGLGSLGRVKRVRPWSNRVHPPNGHSRATSFDIWEPHGIDDDHRVIGPGSAGRIWIGR